MFLRPGLTGCSTRSNNTARFDTHGIAIYLAGGHQALFGARAGHKIGDFLMCGLAGLVLRKWDQDFAGAYVAAAAQYLARRGPDGFNCKRITPELVLAQARLSIIDLEGGTQPMSDAYGDIVYNGEIYNYRELKKAGDAYRTHSDTEVLLKGLNDLGVDFLNQIDGMFAFAHYDRRSNHLTLGRDQFGIKPLYYYADQDRIGFASRLQPLMLLSKKTIHQKGLAEYYFTRACRGANTIFTDIIEVLPGEAITFDLNSFAIIGKGIWVTPHVPRRDQFDETEALHALTQAMRLSIDRHLVADVPVASLLSGGVDSSLITALAAQRRPDLSAFSIGFYNKKFDESGYAAAVCQKYKIRHHVRYCDSGEFAGALSEWPEVMDDVVADPSAVMLYIVSQFARDMGFKVVLSGDGADELFGGYNQYYRFQLAQRLYAYARYFPWAADIVRVLTNNQSRYVHFARMATRDPNYYGTGMIFEPHLIRSLVEAEGILDEKRENLTGAIELDLHHRLPDDMLTRTDRATMHASIEARVPFLTRYVGEVSWSLSEDFLIRGRQQKYLLKRMAEKYVPSECIYRPKIGFDLPLADWFRRDMKPFVCDTLASTWQAEYLLPGAMQGIVDDHLAQRNNNADKIWAFVLLDGNVRHLRAITLDTIGARYNFETAQVDYRHQVKASGEPDTQGIFAPTLTASIGVRPALSLLLISPDPSVPGGVSGFVEMMKTRLKACRITSLWVGSQHKQKESVAAILKRLSSIPFQVARLVRSGEIDVVHINPSLDRSMKSVLRDGLILLMLRVLRFKSIMIYFHGWDLETARFIRGNSVVRWAFVHLLRGARAIMVLAPEFKDDLAAMGVPDKLVVVTRTMFDSATLKPLEKTELESSRPYLLFMSRFEKAKGVYELLDAFAQIKDDFPDVDLVMAGHGDEYDGLLERAESLNINDRVKFTGYVVGTEKLSLLQNCMVFALPTYFPEGMPIALLEAMGAGKPVLTARVGGIPHIIHEPENGIVLNHVDVTQVTQALRRMLSDPQKWAEVGKHNAEYARTRFDVQVVTAEIEAIYHDIARI
ncbi:MAG: asparagine synthase (glutamine-hydrolyzing) [Alphaproteobacteria bacterium]